MDALLHWLHLNSFAPHDLLIVLALVIIEILLSCDNAVVLAMQVKPLPPEQRNRALHYSIVMAYVFRVAALAVATWIMSVWWLKILGGVYLIWLAIKELRKKDDGDDAASRESPTMFGMNAFWSTVVALGFTDIVFSIDSIAAAVALSDKLWILILGGFIGILVMRFAAQGFIRLLDLFPRLETAAFIAVGIIGVKLLLEFPADVVGRSHVFPTTTTYATAQEYEKLVGEYAKPLFEIPHTVIINSAAAPEPQRQVMEHALQASYPSDQVPDLLAHEFARAESSWNMRHRSFIDIEGWVSSLVVLLIFVGGFFRKKSEVGSRKSEV